MAAKGGEGSALDWSGGEFRVMRPRFRALTVRYRDRPVADATVDKKPFEIEPGAGVVLPVRVNIYAYADGKTVVAYGPA